MEFIRRHFAELFGGAALIFLMGTLAALLVVRAQYCPDCLQRRWLKRFGWKEKAEK